MTALTLSAPAKINLWLRIVRRRDDGYHDIDSRLAPLTLWDEVTLTPDPDVAAGAIRFTCDDGSLPADDSNLAVAAIRRLEQRTGPLPGMRLHLAKRIPHGAGLGGGSSDAAAALLLVRAAFRPDLPDDALRAAAAETGSDVPFFLCGTACDVSGRGEIVTPVEGVPDLRILLVKLPFSVPTPWAYRQWQASRWMPGFPSEPQELPWGTVENDLERPVWEKFPVLGSLKARLLATPGVQAALMSGSGSTVFAVLDGAADLEAVLAAVADEAGAEFWHAESRVAAVSRVPRVVSATVTES